MVFFLGSHTEKLDKIKIIFLVYNSKVLTRCKMCKIMCVAKVLRRTSTPWSVRREASLLSEGMAKNVIREDVHAFEKDNKIFQQKRMNESKQ